MDHEYKRVDRGHIHDVSSIEINKMISGAVRADGAPLAILLLKVKTEDGVQHDLHLFSEDVSIMPHCAARDDRVAEEFGPF